MTKFKRGIVLHSFATFREELFYNDKRKDLLSSIRRNFLKAYGINIPIKCPTFMNFLNPFIDCASILDTTNFPFFDQRSSISSSNSTSSRKISSFKSEQLATESRNHFTYPHSRSIDSNQLPQRLSIIFIPSPLKNGISKFAQKGGLTPI